MNKKLAAALAVSHVLTSPAFAAISVAGGSINSIERLSFTSGVSAPLEQALSWSGHGGLGSVGRGWALPFHAIDRCGASIEIDGSRRTGPVFSENDKLCLNGSRLIPTTESGGSPVTGAATGDAAGLSDGSFREYRSEKNANLRVRAYGAATPGNLNSGPAYFKVWFGSGAVSTFGANATVDSDGPSNSTVKTASGFASGALAGTASRWLVSEASNANGETLRTKYQISTVTSGIPTFASSAAPSTTVSIPATEVLLKELRAGSSRVIFEYEDHPSSKNEVTFFGGGLLVSTKRLKEANGYIGDTGGSPIGTPSVGSMLVSSYRFNYDSENYLSSYRVCDSQSASAKCAPETVFTYTPANEHYSFSQRVVSKQTATAGWHEWRDWNPKNTMGADFDGDGLTDVAVGDGIDMNFWKNNGDGSFTPAGVVRGEAVMFIPPNEASDYSYGRCEYKQSFVDMNRDGLVDILRTRISVHDDQDCQRPASAAHFLLNKGNFSFEKTSLPAAWDIEQPIPKTGVLEYTPMNLERLAFREALFEDFNGDGNIDMLVSRVDQTVTGALSYSRCMQDGSCTELYLGDAQYNLTKVSTPLASTGTYFGKQGPTDIDGDGLPDFVFTNLMGVRSAEYNYEGGAFKYYVALNAPNQNFSVIAGPSCATNEVCTLHTASFVKGAGNLLFTSKVNAQIPVHAINRNELHVVVRELSSTLVSKAFNMASGPEFPLTGIQTPDYGHGRIFMHDYNGDSAPDILLVAQEYAKSGIYMNDGNGVFTKNTSTNINSSLYFKNTIRTAVEGPTTTLRGYWTQTGTPGLLSLGWLPKGAVFNSPPPHYIYETTGTSPARALLSVTSSLGSKTTVQYADAYRSDLGDGIGKRVTSDRGTAKQAQLPVIDVFPSGYFVVKQKSTAASGTGTVDSDYVLLGMKSNPSIKRNMGARETRVQTPHAGGFVTNVTESGTVSRYDFAPVRLRSYATRIQGVDSATPTSESTIIYCDAASTDRSAAIANNRDCTPPNTPLKRAYELVLTKKAWGTDGYSQGTSVTTRDMDGHGNVTNMTVDKSSPVPGDTFQSVTTRAMKTPSTACTSIYDCAWLVDLVDTQTVTNTIGTVSLPSASSGGNQGPTANPGSVAFPDTAVLTRSQPLVVTVKNQTAAPLKVSQVSLSSNQFVLISNGCSDLQAGGVCNVSIAFEPSSGGAKSGTLNVQTDAVVNPQLSVQMSGAGTTGGAVPFTVTATNAQTSKSVTLTYTVKNSGSVSVTLNDLAIDSLYGFTHLSGTCSVGMSLAENAACTYTIVLPKACESYPVAFQATNAAGHTTSNYSVPLTDNIADCGI